MTRAVRRLNASDWLPATTRPGGRAPTSQTTATPKSARSTPISRTTTRRGVCTRPYIPHISGTAVRSKGPAGGTRWTPAGRHEQGNASRGVAIGARSMPSRRHRTTKNSRRSLGTGMPRERPPARSVETECKVRGATSNPTTPTLASLGSATSGLSGGACFDSR